MKKSLKSQVAIFIVIAVVIVAMSIFLLSKNNVNFNVFSDQKPSYKVNQFVLSCMETQTSKAVNEIGLHGGWLYSPPLIYINKNTEDFLVTSGEGYDFFGTKTPYWYHYNDVSKNFKLNIPEFDSEDKFSIKNQISRYLRENLDKNCLNKFKSFKDEFNIEYNKKTLNPKVTFNNNKIIIDLSFPIKVSLKNENKTEIIEKFQTSSQNKLKIPYYLARDIVISESKSSFVETRIFQMLVPYMDAQRRDLLPPTYEYKMTYDFRPWQISNLVKLTKQILSSNIGNLQFLNTKSNIKQLPEELKNSEFAKGVYASFNKDYLSENSLVKTENPEIFDSFKGYSVTPTFEYFYPLNFRIDPSLGNQILFPKPEALFGILPIFFTQYTSVYEMHMPISFKIKDAKNMNDEFEFNFFIEANIDYNGPLKNNLKPDFVNNLQPVIENGKSLICDSSQYISKPIYLNITDPINFGKNSIDSNNGKIGVEGAIIKFNCRGLSTCFIGETKLNGDSKWQNISQVAINLPTNCNPGKLEIFKPGYSKLVFENLNPNLANEINLGEQEMYSTKKFKAKVKILKTSDSRYANGRGLEREESGIIIVKNLKNEQLSQIIEINYTNLNNLSLDLTPGQYSLQGFVTYARNFTIASKQICYNKGVIFKKKECKTIPEVKLESWLSANTVVKEFTISKRDIIQNSQFVINLVDIPVPTSFEELEGIPKNIETISRKPFFEKN